MRVDKTRLEKKFLDDLAVKLCLNYKSRLYVREDNEDSSYPVDVPFWFIEEIQSLPKLLGLIPRTERHLILAINDLNYSYPEIQAVIYDNKVKSKIIQDLESFAAENGFLINLKERKQLYRIVWGE